MNTKAIIKSFNLNDNLNDKIWDGDKINAKVRDKLITIAEDFFNHLSINWVNIDDIILTGSIANYNWSKYSDVDLHIIIDYKKIHKNKNFVAEFLHSKKDLWNLSHNVHIFDFPVELYPQGTDEGLTADGVYSLKKDKWLKKPNKKEVEINEKEVESYSKKYMRKIDDLNKAKKTKDLLERINKLKKELREFRTKALIKKGEFSSENLTYKLLRRSGYLDKLHDLKLEIYDEILSI